MNPFAAPSVKKLYGGRPWARSGNGVIVFSSRANQFASPLVSWHVAAQKPQPQIIPLGDIATNVANKLSGHCGEFVKSLYKTVAGKYPKYEPYSKDFNLLEVFKAINSRDGAIVFKEDLVVGGDPAGGTVSGIIGNPAFPATIYISVHPIYIITPVARAWAQQYGYVMTVIHETFHLAHKNGDYSDEEMARAVYDLTGTPGLPEDGSPVSEWSDYWNKVLMSNCPEKEK